ncbi:MAG: DUF1667 domain-containing protein [Clostridia bacterium]|nr:DUF1667 domain-containing protein [Clostridia bacterium]
MEKDIICTVCPTGCIINVKGDEKSISSIEGFTCPRGKTYAEAEFLAPVRTLTSTVKVEGGSLVACRSKNPLPKDKVMDVMKEIHALNVKAPVKRGDVLIANVLGTGVDIVATGELELQK